MTDDQLRAPPALFLSGVGQTMVLASSLHFTTCPSASLGFALGSSAGMLVLCPLKGGCLIALVMHPHGKDDPDPDIGKCSHGHGMAFAFRSFALVIVSGPRFTLRRLPGKVLQSIAQGFDAAQATIRFGIH